MEISKININGTNYNIADTVTSINGKTGAISASDIEAVLSSGGYDISGSAGYTAGTGISISELNAISVTYGNTSGTACQGNDSRLSDSRPASDVYSWAKAETKPSYSYSEISGTPSSLPASDVSDWAKANSKPSYNLDEVTDGTSRKIPTKVSELTNDSGYLTSHQSLSGYATESWVGQQGYLTSHQSLSGYATESWVSSKFNDVLGIDASGVSDLVSILSDNDTATGILNVIASKANASSIPTKVSDLTNDTGFITSYTNTVTSINGKTGEIAAADMAVVLTAAGYALTDTNTWPTALSQLSNDVGYITGITSSMVTTALGYTPATTDTNTWRPITNTYTGSDEGTSLSQYGANALYNALVNGYAAEAGYASSAGSVAWSNVSSRPTALSSFTNDSGYITSSGSCSYANSAGSATYATVVNTLGNDISLSTPDSSSNDSGDIVWKYGNGLEKVRLWTLNSYTTASGLNYRVYKEDGTRLYNGSIATMADIPSSLPASDVYSWAKLSSKPSYSYSEISGRPTKLSDLTNDVGYITSYTDTNTWRPITDTYTGSDTGTSVSQAGTNALYNALVNGYASSAGTASYLSGFENNNNSGKDANKVTYNAHTYYTSNGPSTSLGASANYGALYSQAYSTSWVAQIAQDYINGRLFVRGKNSGTWQDWKRIANYDEIPTNTNQLTNGAGFITSSGSCSYASSAGSAPASDVYSWAKASTKPSYSYSEISGTPGSLPASDVYSWAKASSKPSYAYSEIGYSAYTATTSGALTLDGSTYPLCCITLNGNISSVAFSSYPPAGHSCHIMFNNTSSSDYTVAIAHGTLKCPEGQDISLTVKAGGYAEIDVLHVANVAYFVRGV